MDLAAPTPAPDEPETAVAPVPWADETEVPGDRGEDVDAFAPGAPAAGAAPAPATDDENGEPTFAATEASAKRAFPATFAATGARTENLGLASRAFPVVGAQLVAGRMLLVSRNLTPSRLVSFDLATRRVGSGADVTIPAGVGAWGTARASDRLLYIGQFGAPGRGNLFAVDPAARPLAPVAVAALDANYIWDLSAAPDGTVYGVAARTDGSNFVFDYSPVTRLASDLGQLAAGEAGRSVASNETYLFYGGSSGSGALLRAMNRATRATVRLFHTQIDRDRSVYTLERTGAILAAGTNAAGGGRAGLATLDLGTNAARFVRAGSEGDAGTARPKLIDAIAIAGRTVYFTARPSGRLYRYDLDANVTTALGTPVPRSETRGLFIHGAVLVGASAEGSVWTYDPRTRQRARYDLLGSGVAPGGELSQSIVADGTRVYVGGNFGVQARDVRTRATYRFFVPGEAKDMAVAEGRLYMAMYPVGELWSHTPGATTASPVAQFPADQNRPTVIRSAADRRALFIGTASDARGGGAILRHDLATRQLAIRENPFGNVQSVTSLAYARGSVYLGGGSGEHPRIAAVDANTLAEQWRLDDPVPGGGAIVGMVERGGRLYGYTTRGFLVVVNLTSHAVESASRADTDGGGRMTLAGDAIYGVNEDTLRRFDPATGRSTVVASDLRGAHWGFPALAGEPGGAVYVIERTNVLRLVP
jgi:hypothetical protein